MNSLLPVLSENYKNKNFSKIKLIINNALKVMFAFS
jgi:O-antigen/teichoic acid export membrane protein